MRKITRVGRTRFINRNRNIIIIKYNYGNKPGESGSFVTNEPWCQNRDHKNISIPQCSECGSELKVYVEVKGRGFIPLDKDHRNRSIVETEFLLAHPVNAVDCHWTESPMNVGEDYKIMGNVKDSDLVSLFIRWRFVR